VVTLFILNPNAVVRRPYRFGGPKNGDKRLVYKYTAHTTELYNLTVPTHDKMPKAGCHGAIDPWAVLLPPGKKVLEGRRRREPEGVGSGTDQRQRGRRPGKTAASVASCKGTWQKEGTMEYEEGFVPWSSALALPRAPSSASSSASSRRFLERWRFLDRPDGTRCHDGDRPTLLQCHQSVADASNAWALVRQQRRVALCTG
jgi:hypothetical protein